MSVEIKVRLVVDTREPWPHPWQEYLPTLWTMERGLLETGDIAIAALIEGVVIERKTAQDLASCMTNGRDRFERELKRGRYTGRFIVIMEGSFNDLLVAARGMHPNSVVGTIASWTVRFCPFVFAGDRAHAANFAFRSLGAQVRDILRTAKA